jgi:hypothetical protein
LTPPCFPAEAGPFRTNARLSSLGAETGCMVKEIFSTLSMRICIDSSINRLQKWKNVLASLPSYSSSHSPINKVIEKTTLPSVSALNCRHPFLYSVRFAILVVWNQRFEREVFLFGQEAAVFRFLKCLNSLIYLSRCGPYFIG